MRAVRFPNPALLVIAFCLLLSLSPPIYADTYTFSTLPASGDLSSPAGSTVGWGYSISNQSLTDWLVTIGLSSGVFLNGTPNTLFDFPILAPNSSLSTSFDATNNLGLYQFTWDTTAPAGFVNSGDFVLSAEWWTGDPSAGGSFLSTALDQSSPYSVNVPSQTPAPVPEPSTLSLFVVGMGGLYLLRRKSLHPNRPL